MLATATTTDTLVVGRTYTVVDHDGTNSTRTVLAAKGAPPENTAGTQFKATGAGTVANVTFVDLATTTTAAATRHACQKQ